METNIGAATAGTAGGVGQPQQGSAADAAKKEAAGVAAHAGEAGGKVAGTAKDEAANVAKEVGTQAKNLLSEARSQAVSQASEQQARVASGLRSISDEFSAMADDRQDSGVAGQLVGQAGSRAARVADWLEAREPGDLINEVKEYARRKPGVFIAVAAIAGVAAGRLTKAVMSADSDSDRSSAPKPPPPATTRPGAGSVGSAGMPGTVPGASAAAPRSTGTTP
ncbi:hypothetical protein [Homoserinimonas hongtaonis]|uniref:hypothetical protein n=1 Tax=Homoserinimonas hongtaonis TaxID=2079791 RepID=UPI0011B275DC|nr:hypothetical protein [Salinibacterium hongtaonis]